MMRRYRVDLYGRKAGAIGVAWRLPAVVVWAVDQESACDIARQTYYDAGFEHLTIAQVTHPMGRAFEPTEGD